MKTCTSQGLGGPAEASAHGAGRLYQSVKAIMDRVGAACLCVLFCPAMLFIALLIKLDSPGPVLFRQERIGEGGKSFILYKFRTMHTGADTSVHERHVREFMKGGGASMPVRKISNDARVTGLGRVLRKSSMDELPQFFNILRGELSLVGPRPPIPYEVAEYEDWHHLRLNVKPGLTGLWQVTGRSQMSFDQMVLLDIKYIRTQSLLLDLWILIRTVPAVISGKGAG